MSLGPPTEADVRRICDALGWETSAEDVELFTTCVARSLATCERVDALAARARVQPTGRARGHRPARAENPLGAWYWRCEVGGADQGALAGRRVALKDTVSLAGVPMAVGVDLLEDYVPEEDATV